MDGESESKQVIPAHKFVLSISSLVFEAMFYGELAKTKDSIELPDCAYESLLELSRYMYRNAATKVLRFISTSKKHLLCYKCSDIRSSYVPRNWLCWLNSMCRCNIHFHQK